MIRKLTTTAAAIGLACAGATAPAKAQDVVIGVPNWPSVAATANILKVVIEDYMGLSVELQNGTNPIVFEAMDKGSMHAHPEVWIPNQQNLHDTYAEERGTVARNPNGVPAFQGMCVPQFVADEHGVTAIEDLTDPEKAALFDSDGDGMGELWVGAPGWASTNVEKIRAKSYGYDQTLELVEFDETLAYANLDAAITAGQPWVGFCYAPHYLFVLHDVHILEEPPYDAAKWNVVQPTDDPAWLEISDAGVAWDTAYLHVYYATELEDSYPEVASLFSNVELTVDHVSEMTYAVVVDKEDDAEFAKRWVAENEDLVISWLSQ